MTRSLTQLAWMGTANRESSRRAERRPRVLVPALAGAVLFLAGIALVLWSMFPAPTLGDLEHDEVSAFSHIRIRRDGDVRAMTFVRDNGQEAVQSRINLASPHLLVSPYAHRMFAGYLYQPHPTRVLIVGLGGGAMVRFLAHHEPAVQIDAVEIDPAVVRLADRFFGVRSGGNVRVHTADAIKFIESSADRYDLILMDAFLRPSSDTDATGVPSGLKTHAFLSRLKATLNPGGVVAFNINEHERIAEDVASVKAAFGQAVVFRSPPSANKVVIATEGGVPADDDLRGRIAALDARFAGALSFREILQDRE